MRKYFCRQAAKVAKVATFAAIFTLASCTQGLSSLGAHASEPRAFGYHVGDRIVRDVDLDIPAPLQLDLESLPRVGVHGRPLELQRIDRARRSAGMHLTLHYQVLLSPPEVRTLEIPPFQLRFTGGDRVQELRIEAWPVTVSPLVPVDVSARNGLGDLRPDLPPPRIDEDGPLTRLGLCAAVATVSLLVLVHACIGVPWRSRQQRPFAVAWRSLRRLPAEPPIDAARAALAQLHEALNRSAGQVLFAAGVAGFVQREPRFAPLANDLAEFFQRSRTVFFADPAQARVDGRWLQDLSRRLRNAERGSP